MNAKRMLKYSMASLMFALVGFKQKLPNDAVLKSFREKYSKAKYSTWKHLVGTIWEAAFLWKEKECTALFKENGEWLETRTYLPMGNLPKVVWESFEKANTSNTLVKVYQLENSKGIYYEFQLDKGNDPSKKRYDGQGKLVGNSIL